MQQKYKLLFTIYGLGMGGAERSLINLLNELDYEKFEVDLYIFDLYGRVTQNGLIKEVNSNVNIILPDKTMLFLTATKIKILLKNFSIKRAYYWFFSKLSGKKYKSTYRKNQVLWKKSYLKLLKNLEKHYDCAIAFMHSYPSYYVIDKVNADKKILWVHNDYNALIKGKDFDSEYFKKADKVVTISEKCAQVLKDVFPDLKEKFMSLYNLSPINKLKRLADEYMPSEYDSNAINILSVGRLTSQKGFDISINAAKKLKEAGVNFKWIILGEGPLRESLTNMIDNSIKENVLLLGNKINPYPYFKNCDIVVQSSRFEGKSIVLDEAKIFCKLIICSNYNTAGDQIIDNYNGLIVPLEDAEAIKEAIIKLAKDNDIKDKFIDNLKNEKYVTIEEYESLFINGE